MRLSLIFVGFLVLGSASAQSAAISTAVASVAGLGKTMAGFLPAMVTGWGPIPLVLALKGLAFLKFKKATVLAAPLIAPIALAKAKYGIMKFKLGLAKSALHAAGQTTANLIEWPLKVTAVKMGALSGAIAGAKGGLASYRTHPRKSLLRAFTVPFASLVSGLESRIPAIPTKDFTVSFKSDASVPEAVPEVEVHEPVYGGKPKPTTTTTTTTVRPLPSYVPEPAQPSY